MATTVSTSSQYSINWRDAEKAGLTAAIVAFVGAAGSVLSVWVTTSSFAIDFHSLIIALKLAIAAFVSEIIRRFMDSNKIVVNKVSSEDIKAIKEGDAKVTVTPK